MKTADDGALGSSGRRMPSFRIRKRSVEGLISKMAAASPFPLFASQITCYGDNLRRTLFDRAYGVALVKIN